MKMLRFHLQVFDPSSLMIQPSAICHPSAQNTLCALKYENVVSSRFLKTIENFKCLYAWTHWSKKLLKYVTYRKQVSPSNSENKSHFKQVPNLGQKNPKEMEQKKKKNKKWRHPRLSEVTLLEILIEDKR